MTKSLKNVRRFPWMFYKIFIYNPAIFLWGCIVQGVPPHKWLRAWRHITEVEDARMAKNLNDMAIRGEILRRIDSEGYPVYYPLGYFDND